MRKIFSLLVVISFFSCQTDDDAAYQNIPIDFQVPSNFPPLAYDMTNNPLTEKGFELGKKIFMTEDSHLTVLFLVVFVIFKKMLLPITDIHLVMVWVTEWAREMLLLFKIWLFKHNFSGMVHQTI